MASKKEITVARSFGRASKEEIFEKLIWLVCGKRVKLKPAPPESTRCLNEIRQNGL